MSAPLVVNTRDGACWTRRTVTEGGIALYALAGVCDCPEFVMVTQDELAARGIVGSADALPVPVGTEPLALSDERLAEIRNHVAGIRNWSLGNLAARDLLGEVERLRAERHTTNEALSDAAEALRAQQDRITELEQREASVAAFVAERAGYITAIRNCHPDNGHDYDRWQGHAAARRQLSELLGLPVAWPQEDSASVEKSTAKLKQVLAPSEGEFHDVLHHSYDTPHDLPAPGDRQ